MFADAEPLALLERSPTSVKINKFGCTGHEARLLDCPYLLECTEIGIDPNCTRYAHCNRVQTADAGVTCPTGELYNYCDEQNGV